MQDCENNPGIAHPQPAQPRKTARPRWRLWVNVLACGVILAIVVLGALPLFVNQPGHWPQRQAEQMLGSIKSQVLARYTRTLKLPATLTEAGVMSLELQGKHYTVEDKIIANADGSFTLRANPVNEEDSRYSLRVELDGGNGEFRREE